MACMLAEMCHISHSMYCLLVTVTMYLIFCLSHEQWGQTAVFQASAEGHTKVVKLLVQAKADIELQNKVDRVIVSVED